MTAHGAARHGLFHGPLSDGFSRRVFRLMPGAELDAELLLGAIVVVERGVLELVCRAGTCGRFGRGSVIPLAGLPVVRLRNAGRRRVVLVAVSRARTDATDEFSSAAGSHSDD
jgi:hypothetical protein